MLPDSNLDLFFYLCTTSRTEDFKQGIHVLTKEEWESLVIFCHVRGVAPYLYARLADNHTLEYLPSEIAPGLKKLFLANAATNLAAKNQLLEILTELRLRQIPVIPLKGIYLATRVYQNPATRTMGDLDILLKTEDLPETVDALKKHSYKIGENFWESPGHHLPPIKKPGALFPVEIHWRLSPPNRMETIENESLWLVARDMSIEGIPCLELNPAHTLIHICQHAVYQHYFANGVKAICDIDAIVRFYAGEMNWGLFRETAKTIGSTRGIFLALWLSKKFLGTLLPAEVDETIAGFNFQEDIVLDARASMAGGVEFPDNPPIGLAEKIKWWTDKTQKVLRETRFDHAGAKGAPGLAVSHSKANRIGYVIRNNLAALKNLRRNNREDKTAQSQRHLRRWLNEK